MVFEQNKQYNFKCNFLFPRNSKKEIKSSLFLLDNKLYILSFVDDKRFSKHVFDRDSRTLLAFENYRKDIITCSGETINKITECYLQSIKLGLIKSDLEGHLNADFNLEVEDYSLNKDELRYCFSYKNSKNTNNLLYKNVEFFSSYANLFSRHKNKQYLNLHLFKDNQDYWYCISNSSGDNICKFIFNNNILLQKDFILVQRENYMQDADKIEFSILKDDFNKITNTSEQMHLDIADDEMPYYKSFDFGFLKKMFEELPPLPLIF